MHVRLYFFNNHIILKGLMLQGFDFSVTFDLDTNLSTTAESVLLRKSASISLLPFEISEAVMNTVLYVTLFRMTDIFV